MPNYDEIWEEATDVLQGIQNNLKMMLDPVLVGKKSLDGDYVKPTQSPMHRACTNFIDELVNIAEEKDANITREDILSLQIKVKESWTKFSADFNKRGLKKDAAYKHVFDQLKILHGILSEIPKVKRRSGKGDLFK